MKKIVMAILLMLMIVMLCGCGAKVESEPMGKVSMFVLVESGQDYRIVYHRDTKVMYAISFGGMAHGIFTVMLNADGTPQLWGEE